LKKLSFGAQRKMIPLVLLHLLSTFGCSVDCVWVNHKYDNPGQLTCECVCPDEECIGNGQCEEEPQCDPDHNSGGGGDCVWVNHVNDNPGQLTCECVAPNEECVGSGGCEIEPECEPDQNSCSSSLNQQSYDLPESPFVVEACADSTKGLTSQQIQGLTDRGFVKCVFGAFETLAVGTACYPDELLITAAVTVANILDQDMDGVADDQAVAETLTFRGGPLLQGGVTWEEESRGDSLEQVGFAYAYSLQTWNGPADARAIITEEAFHMVTMAYSEVYPEQFGMDDFTTSVACREMAAAQCVTWHHPENQCPNEDTWAASPLIGGCNEANCDCTEWFHQVVLVMAGQAPGWYSNLLPRSRDSLAETLSQQFKDLLANPAYHQLQAPLPYSYTVTGLQDTSPAPTSEIEDTSPAPTQAPTEFPTQTPSADGQGVCCEAMTLSCLRCAHPDLTDEQICDRHLREYNDPACPQQNDSGPRVCCMALTLGCLSCSHPDLTDEQICDRYLREYNDPACAGHVPEYKQTGFERAFASPPLVIGIGVALLFLSGSGCWWVFNSRGRAHVRPNRFEPKGPAAAQELPRSTATHSSDQYPRKRRSVASTI